MNALTTVVLIACSGTMFAQGAPNGATLTGRIGSFAHETRLALATIDPRVESERACAEYAFIDSMARTLAAELCMTQAPVPYPAGELATIQALACHYQESDPQLAYAYQVAVIQVSTQAILANAPPTGYNSLTEVRDLAWQAGKARSAAQLARVHQRLLRRVTDLAELVEPQ